jgi:Histone methylation protein DOT1
MELQRLTNTLQSMVAELEQDDHLDKPDHLRQRLDALDRLDEYLMDEPTPDTDTGSGVRSSELYRRARSIHARLEAANIELYQGIRREIQQGLPPASLLRWASDMLTPPQDQGYDYLDELISGVLQFEDPGEGFVQLTDEMVFYQPTPARHIFDLLRRTALTEQDVLIDLGSGLGHVPLLVAICTKARSVGIELDATYVDCARKSAKALNLNNVVFHQQDARAADLSDGTVFHLYTPFTGIILRTVLDSLKQVAASHRIRVSTLGPCTSIIAKEPWLDAIGTTEPNRISIFRSRE